MDPATRAMVLTEVQTDPTFQVVGRETLFTLPQGDVVVPNGDFYDVTSDDQRFLMVRRYVAEADGIPSEMIVVENFFEILRARVPN